MTIFTKISEHFTVEEFTKSQIATRYKINNTIPDRYMTNVEKLCKEFLEPIRKRVGEPILITSGYRSQKVNQLTGGSPKSAHLYGLAADFHCNKYTNEQLMNLIIKMYEDGDISEYDQLIYEFGEAGWIHLGISVTNPRVQNLEAATNRKGVVRYFPYKRHIPIVNENIA